MGRREAFDGVFGITTVCGEPEKRCEMASAICRHLGRPDVPIHPGCPVPLSIAQRQPTCPQAARLGDWPRDRFAADSSAVDFLRRTIRTNPGARDVDGVKRRTRSGMGRCQGGFCGPAVMQLLSRELGIPMEQVTKSGVGSEMLTGRIGE